MEQPFLWAFIVAACALTLIFCVFSFRFLKSAVRNFSLRPLLIGFKPKIWMTFWLGLFFFGFYTLLVTLSAYTLTSELKLTILRFAYNNPVKIIYIALILFTCTSISIIWVRMIIKFLYNNKT